jgi:glutathione synthase
MKHILYVNKFEKLNLKKDSSLFLALSLMSLKKEVFILFEDDLSWSQELPTLKLYRLKGLINKDFYMSEIEAHSPRFLKLNPGDTFHMRLDPPVDGQYLRALWILRLWKESGVRMINDPSAILLYNEKILAYQEQDGVPSWIGSSSDSALEFIKTLPESVKEIVLKPLDLFSGLEVEKCARDHKDLISTIEAKANKLKGMFIIQPFLPAVFEGELRVITINAKIIGTILKVPKKGEFISNIASGAQFRSARLNEDLSAKIQKMAIKLKDKGLAWVAFDVLGDLVQEANITCPGLLVETSHAAQKNLAFELVKLMEDSESDL